MSYELKVPLPSPSPPVRTDWAPTAKVCLPLCLRDASPAACHHRWPHKGGSSGDAPCEPRRVTTSGTTKGVPVEMRSQIPGACHHRWPRKGGSSGDAPCEPSGVWVRENERWCCPHSGPPVAQVSLVRDPRSVSAIAGLRPRFPTTHFWAVGKAGKSWGKTPGRYAPPGKDAP